MCVSLLSRPASARDVTGQGIGAGPECHCHVSHTLPFFSPCPLQYSTSLALLIYPASVFFAHSGKLTAYEGGLHLHKSVPPFPFIALTVLFHSVPRNISNFPRIVYICKCYNLSEVCVLCSEYLSRSLVTFKSR